MEFIGILLAIAMLGGLIYFVKRREAGKLPGFDKDRGGSAR